MIMRYINLLLTLTLRLMTVCVTDDGCEPGWYVSELCHLIADYCLTWREPLLTYQLYGIVVTVIGTSFNHFVVPSFTTFSCYHSLVPYGFVSGHFL